MRNFLHTLFIKIIKSFWLIPSSLAAAAIVGSFTLNGLDHLAAPWLLEHTPTLASSTADGARTTLSTIAGSTITVTGVLLSTMVVVLTLTSQQYGPRLVNNFIEDRVCQFVIGFFAGCFIYSIITLKNVQAGGVEFVPHISLMFGVLLGIVCIGLMIYFVQHISSAIQVQSIMRRVYGDLNRSIDALFPEQLANPGDHGKTVGDGRAEIQAEQRRTTELTSDRADYLQFIQEDELMNNLSKEDLQIELRLRPGDFVLRGAVLAVVYHTADLSDESRQNLMDCFCLGRFPTSEQDAMFPIRQLEEIAIRALSPGINDPHTAVECLDYLTSSMQSLATRDWPSPLRRDPKGNLRVIAEPQPFEKMLRQAFQQIHFYGREDISIVNQTILSLNYITQSLSSNNPHRTIVTKFNQELTEASKQSLQLEYQRVQIAPVV